MEVLKGADIDQDGEISYEEFMLSLTDANFFLNPKNMRAAFNHFDLDKNGAICLEEFKKLVQVGDENDDNEQ